MIPLQDVIPTGKTPVATLALIALNLSAAAIATSSGVVLVPPLAHTSLLPLVLSLLYLWLFGDNVEARLGRLAFVVIYAVGGFMPGLGAAGGVTAILGSYFVMLPQSRVLLLVPLPAVLVEAPAVALLTLWAMLHVLRYSASPRTMWLFAAAFVIGAIAARLLRPRVRW